MHICVQFRHLTPQEVLQEVSQALAPIQFTPNDTFPPPPPAGM